jgi:hypothetical protein
MVVQEELPDQNGVEFVRELATARHPIARRAIVQAKGVAREGDASDVTLLARNDLRGVSIKLAGWLLARDAGMIKALMREVERLGA